MSYGPVEEPLGVPDEGPLEQIAIDAPVSAQPDWVRELVGETTPHEHELRSVRTAEHKGRHIEIVTSYEISIDGQPVHFHASVGDDGLLPVRTPQWTFSSTGSTIGCTRSSTTP